MCQRIVDYREVAKLNGTYVEALAAVLPAGDTRPASVTEAANALFAQIEGDNGLLAVRERELRSNQVITGLQREVGQLAVELAGRIVGEVLADDAKARAAVDRFIADLERAASEAGR